MKIILTLLFYLYLIVSGLLLGFGFGFGDYSMMGLGGFFAIFAELGIKPKIELYS